MRVVVVMRLLLLLLVRIHAVSQVGVATVNRDFDWIFGG